jgi:hypothetical protein
MSLTVIELKDGFLQVSHTTVHELCAFTTGSTGEIVPFDTGDLETSAGGVEGGSGAGGSAADDEEVKDIIAVVLVLVFSQDGSGLGASLGCSMDVDT